VRQVLTSNPLVKSWIGQAGEDRGSEREREARERQQVTSPLNQPNPRQVLTSNPLVESLFLNYLKKMLANGSSEGQDLALTVSNIPSSQVLTSNPLVESWLYFSESLRSSRCRVNVAHIRQSIGQSQSHIRQSQSQIRQSQSQAKAATD
jgi:hypothetical protein